VLEAANPAPQQWCSAHLSRLGVKVPAFRVGLCRACFSGEPLGVEAEAVEAGDRRPRQGSGVVWERVRRCRIRGCGRRIYRTNRSGFCSPHQRKGCVSKTEEKRIRARERTWYAANREKVAARTKRYREANPEKIADSKHAYYESNKERLKKKGRLYYRANRKRILAAHSAARAAKQGTGASLLTPSASTLPFSGENALK